jgi:L,D-transpeptidase YcbB
VVMMIAIQRICWLCLGSLLLVALSGAEGWSLQPVRRQNRTSLAAQPLSSKGKDSLVALIQSGNLTDLRWPNFSAYRKDVVEFYQSLGCGLPWVRDLQPTEQAQSVIGILQKASDKGLSADDYDGPRWPARLAKLRPFTQQPSEEDAIRFDLSLTISLMRYISDLHTGRVDPRQFGIEANVSQRKYDLAKFLKEHLVDALDVPTMLSQVEPTYPGYQRTLQALQNYRRLASQESGQPFPVVKRTVKPGQRYAGLPRLARFLRLVGDLPANVVVPPNQTLYQGRLVDAVKRFQYRHKLPVNGSLDARTFEELNVPLTQRVRQIQLTLERWRWMPPEYAESPIVVNIPEFQLRAYDSRFRVAITMKVVVGKAYSHDTPVFMSHLHSVIFRPYWEIPVSIAQAEIIPAITRDRAYLTKQDMEVVDRHGEVVTADSVTSDMAAQIYAGQLSLRQKPGPNNALGLIKFEFPNEYNVYMHDTPARLLFSQSKRDFSHGCIRLEKPAELAAWVLRDNPGWDASRIRAAMDGDATFELKLAHPIPVLIVYGTVIVLEDGIVHFYDDLYGQEVELDQALKQNYPYAH